MSEQITDVSDYILGTSMKIPKDAKFQFTYEELLALFSSKSEEPSVLRFKEESGEEHSILFSKSGITLDEFYEITW